MKYPHVVVFGDSIAWGSFDYERGGWVTRIQAEYMRRGIGQEDFAAIHNCSIPGERLADIFVRYERDVRPRKSVYGEPLISVLAVGINDSPHGEEEGTPLDQFRLNFKKLIAVARQQSDVVMAIEPTNVIDDAVCIYSNESIKRYVEVIRAVCVVAEIPLVPLFGVLQRDHLSDDLLHPSPLGHKTMASIILQELDSIIATV